VTTTSVDERLGSALWSELRQVNPHALAHWGALRAGLGVLVPGTVALLLGRDDLLAPVLFGAFAAVHGRHATYTARAAMQLGFAVLMTVVVVASGLVAASAPPAVLTCCYFGVVALTGYLAARRYGWVPVPSIFLVFAAGAMLQTHLDASGILLDGAAALASGALGAAVGQVGRFFPVRERPRHGRTTLPLRKVLATRGAARDVVLYGVGPALAALISTAAGLAHPSWAAVAATVPLAGASVSARLGRGIHRLLGTTAGVALAASVLTFGPPRVVLFALVVVGMFAVELVIARHYGLASTLITPVALVMSELGAHSDVRYMVLARIAETVIGVSVATALVLLPWRGTARRG
jgi:uncharacterized membrane protein YccC